MKRRKYNWVPDKFDRNDLTYPGLTLTSAPSSIDLRPHCPPVVDQLNLGSCTYNACAGMLGFVEMKDLREKNTDPEVFQPSFTPISRLFGYYFEGFINGQAGKDNGAQVRDAVKVSNLYGFCPEKVWPYKENVPIQRPSNLAIGLAAKHKISVYSRMTSLQMVKTCLTQGYPFIFGFTVFESFESDEVAQTGMMPMPGDNEQVVGGHAVMGAGYDDKKKCLIVRNSWGADWGDKGYFYMPYEYAFGSGLAEDYWTVRK